MENSLKITLYFLMIFYILSCKQNSQEEKIIEKSKINIEIGNTKLTALLENNETARDFLKLLPITITMKELYESEKYAELPVKLSRAEVTRQGYEIGDIGYWAPGNCLVIYYKQTGEIINGLQIIGKIHDNIDVFEKYEGTVIVKISKSN